MSPEGRRAVSAQRGDRCGTAVTGSRSGSRVPKPRPYAAATVPPDSAPARSPPFRTVDRAAGWAVGRPVGARGSRLLNELKWLRTCSSAGPEAGFGDLPDAIDPPSGWIGLAEMPAPVELEIDRFAPGHSLRNGRCDASIRLSMGHYGGARRHDCVGLDGWATSARCRSCSCRDDRKARNNGRLPSGREASV